MADRFFIAPFEENSGLQNNVRPWLIPDEAFAELQDVYQYRGRVRKRFGTRWLGNDPYGTRCRVAMGTLGGGGSLTGFVFTIAADPTLPLNVGQGFSVTDANGNTIFFTIVSGAAGAQQMLRSDGSAAVATFDIGTSQFNITGTGMPAGRIVYFYPAFPVMGLRTYEQSNISNELTVGFDTRYAYRYVTGDGWTRISAVGGGEPATSAVWTGNNAQFFYSTTYAGTNVSDRVLYVTNFNQNEPMRRLSAGQWFAFNPLCEPAPSTVRINSARLIVAFKNRLLFFNTWEGSAFPGTNYPQRVAWSWIGDPANIDAFRRQAGFGGALDATTSEAIVSVEFVKDRLIVGFERSHWEIVFTGNQLQPFAWQKVNTELGIESTFSIVPFDRVVLGIGSQGIHACTGASVDRVDSKIPDEVFKIHNQEDGVYRVYGIRDYFLEYVYWAFPSLTASANFPYPNRILAYNYKKNTWGFFAESITCFGYFQPENSISWDSTTVTWDSSVTWDSGTIQGLFREVLAGNQQGYTFICDSGKTQNDPTLQITNIAAGSLTTLTIIDHNLSNTDYIYIQNATYSDFSNGLNDQIFQVINVIDRDTIEIGPDADFTGTYTGAGIAARVANINIRTKEYNFYAKNGRNAYVSKVDFMVDKTASGRIQVDFYISTSFTPLLQESAQNGTLVGTGTLDTFAYTAANGAITPLNYEDTASRVWHPVYLQAEGEVIQLQLKMNDEQMRDVNVRNADFQLHALVITATPTSYRLQ